MGIYSIKPKFQKVLAPVKNLFIRFKVHPTTINILALIISIIGGILLYYSNRNVWFLILIPIIAFVRTALNALDGLVARKLKVKNQKFGEVLNEFIDRLSDVAIFIGLALTSYANFYLGSFAIIVILLNSYLSILSKAAGGARQYGGIMGKADRMFWLSVASILVLITGKFEIMNYLFVFLIVTTIITMMERFNATKKELYRLCLD